MNLYDKLNEAKNEEWVNHGGDIIIRCSGCDMHLASLVIIRPNAPVTNEVVAKCCYCKDKSFKKEVHGMFAITPGNGTAIHNIKIVDQEIKDDKVYMNILIETRK
jgi:hypothetical protein